jgi:hypothetical protein
MKILSNDPRVIRRGSVGGAVQWTTMLLLDQHQSLVAVHGEHTALHASTRVCRGKKFPDLINTLQCMKGGTYE